MAQKTKWFLMMVLLLDLLYCKEWGFTGSVIGPVFFSLFIKYFLLSSTNSYKLAFVDYIKIINSCLVELQKDNYISLRIGVLRLALKLMLINAEHSNQAKS